MVMSACLPITGFYTSLTLESVKLEANLLALTMFRVITPTILGIETQFLVVLTHGRNHGVHMDAQWSQLHELLVNCVHRDWKPRFTSGSMGENAINSDQTFFNFGHAIWLHCYGLGDGR